MPRTWIVISFCFFSLILWLLSSFPIEWRSQCRIWQKKKNKHSSRVLTLVGKPNNLTQLTGFAWRFGFISIGVYLVPFPDKNIYNISNIGKNEMNQNEKLVPGNQNIKKVVAGEQHVVRDVVWPCDNDAHWSLSNRTKLKKKSLDTRTTTIRP